MAGIRLKTTKQVVPKCYAYTTPGVPAHDGWTKIGFTERDVKTRIREQTHTVGVAYEIRWERLAAYTTEPYGTFTDRNFHAYLKKLGVSREPGTEWFFIDADTALDHFMEFTQNHGVVSARDAEGVLPYTLRDEQEEAVRRTVAYFSAVRNAEFLWNAKPRFGKTLSAYELCKRLGAQNILIVTNRPAIANSWYQDYETFLGVESGYIFVSNVDGIKDRRFVYNREEYLAKVLKMGEMAKGCIEFVSLQDLKGSIYFGGQYDKLAELDGERGIVWDILIVDEAHEGVDTYRTDTAFSHIRRKWTLHLSGTPFKALANDKFPEGAIYNWTYADEQRKRREWDSASETENPYAVLPCLSLFTYQMSDIVRDRLQGGIPSIEYPYEEFAFDLNEFFKTKESGKFVHDAEVDAFLDALTRQEKFPFSTSALREELKHTFWILNRVASAKALAKKLQIHPVFREYEVILAAGDGKLDDEAASANSFDKVTEAIAKYDKTITLSVGQLTTGVTIPEWTAVLMLSNMASPALYMQAAFRAQNPCLFADGVGETYRKQNAYVFDFDPARTLTIFEQFANDLISERGDAKSRKQNVRELLNFFPVYAEDAEGAMTLLDAEEVFSIPRRIHAREVVDRGFMSNFLFANIGGIFGAPREIIDIINKMQALEEPKKLEAAPIDAGTAEALSLNEDGEVALPEERVIGTAREVFGDKVYAVVWDELTATAEETKKDEEQALRPKANALKKLQEQFAKPLADTLMDSAKDQYGSTLKKSTQKQLERELRATTDAVVNRAYGDFAIRDKQLIKERDKKMHEAQHAGAAMSEITKIDEEYERRRGQGYQEMVDTIHEKLRSEETVKKAAQTIVETVETEKLNDKKEAIEGTVRDHLRGFSRTIPAFLMAYGDENTTLANFDALVPEDVFWEVTVNPQNGEGVTLAQFRLLRDGGDYEAESGERKHFDGHLFDEVVFNDAVREFMRRRAALANYFEPDHEEDIFDFIPPQRTNQIFTPKRVVRDMVDRLEQENPGCFDDPKATFADLYMKSGMYLTEIVTRLYQSEHLKTLYPDDAKRLNHIFAEQVYGCAPTEIIYRICLRYLLDFSEEIAIEKQNIRLCDTLEFAKKGTLEEEMRRLFDL